MNIQDSFPIYYFRLAHSQEILNSQNTSPISENCNHVTIYHRQIFFQVKVPKSSKFDLKNALKSLKEGDTKNDENLNKHNDTFVCVVKPRYDKHFYK